MQNKSWFFCLLLLAAFSASKTVFSEVEVDYMAATATALPKAMKAVFAEDKKCVTKMVDVPVPAEGEVLIQVYATCLNRADTISMLIPTRASLRPSPHECK